MADNVVEAVLSSRFQDGVTRALAATSQAVQRQAQTMNRALGAAGQALGLLAAGTVIAGATVLVNTIRSLAQFAGEAGAKVIELSGKVIDQDKNMRSLSGAYAFAQEKLTLYATKLAVAIQQSGVFQEALKRIERAILDLDPSADQLDRVTLASNQFFLAFITGSASSLRGLGAFSTVAVGTWRALTIVFEGGFAVVSLAFTSVLNLLRAVTFAFSLLPGSLGRYFAEATTQIGFYVEAWGQLMRDSAATIWRGFDGVGETSKTLNELAAKLDQAASELREFEGDIRRVQPAAQGTKTNLDALNRSLEQEARLLRDFAGRGADERTQLELQFLADLERINNLEGFSEQRKNQLILEARRVFHTQLAELDALRFQRQQQDNERLIQEEARALREIEQLRERAGQSGAEFLAQTAQANLAILPSLDVAEQRMSGFQEFLGRFAGAVVDAWANFWSDLVTAQDGAFKKLLAGLLNFIADEIQAHAFRLARLSISSFLSGNFILGAKQAAGAAALGAAAGIMRGAAANLADTVRDRQGTFQQVSAPTSQGQQRFSVGASGGAQSSGQAAAQIDRQPPREVIVRIMPERGFIASEVKREIQNRNSDLRQALVKVV